VQANSRITEALAAFRRGDLVRARVLATAQLDAERGPPEVHHLLGLIDCREGRLETGVKHLRDALDAEPDNAAFRVMLARALADSDRVQDALDVAAPRTGTSAAEIALWHVRAEAAQSIGRYEVAAEAWNVLCAARPDDWRAWASLGQSLLQLARFDDSEDAYLRAYSLAPAEASIVHELGSLYERTNRAEELEALLDRSADAGISKEQLPELWAGRMLRQGNSAAAKEMLANHSANRDPVRWHRLKARIAEADGNAAQAFEASRQMNRATPDFDEWRERAAAYREELRELARTITPEWAAALPQMEQVVTSDLAFLVGFPRSGTTLLDTFLMGHHQIRVIEEQGLLVAASQAAGRLVDLPKCSATRLQRAADIYSERLAGEVGRFEGLVVDKAPLNMHRIPLIDVLFGRVPIIFAQRHPCDAVLSGFMQSFIPNLGMASFLDIEDAADFYDAAMSVWTASDQALPLKVHTVVYEELIRDPAHTLRAVVEFLGLEWDERMLDHQATAKARGPTLNPSSNQITQPLTDRASGRWRRYEAQLEPVLPVLLSWADRLGYAH
jgi:tetratricopeptide (TPR) repeat protein